MKNGVENVYQDTCSISWVFPQPVSKKMRAPSNWIVSNLLEWKIKTVWVANNPGNILYGRITWKFRPLLVSVNMEHVFEGFSGESMATLRIQVHQTPPPICVNMERFTGAPSDIRHLNSLTFWVVRLTWNLPDYLCWRSPNFYVNLTPPNIKEKSIT